MNWKENDFFPHFTILLPNALCLASTRPYKISKVKQDVRSSSWVGDSLGILLFAVDIALLECLYTLSIIIIKNLSKKLKWLFAEQFELESLILAQRYS